MINSVCFNCPNTEVTIMLIPLLAHLTFLYAVNLLICCIKYRQQINSTQVSVLVSYLWKTGLIQYEISSSILQKKRSGINKMEPREVIIDRWYESSYTSSLLTDWRVANSSFLRYKLLLTVPLILIMVRHKFQLKN